MWSARFLSHMNHVSVSPTDGNGPTQGQKNSDQGGNWTHDLRVGSPPLYRLSCKVRREQAVGTEDVKVTAMNMYKYKERLRLYKSWPCSTYILNRVNWIENRVWLLGTTCCIRLATLLRYVATCWMMLDQIRKRSHFSCNILDVAWGCTRLATFTQHFCSTACALSPVLVRQGPGPMNIDMLWKCCVRLANNVARRCVEILRAFGQAFKPSSVSILTTISSRPD